jgi:hypothetical protein
VGLGEAGGPCLLFRKATWGGDAVVYNRIIKNFYFIGQNGMAVSQQRPLKRGEGIIGPVRDGIRNRAVSLAVHCFAMQPLNGRGWPAWRPHRNPDHRRVGRFGASSDRNAQGREGRPCLCHFEWHTPSPPLGPCSTGDGNAPGKRATCS